MSQFNLMPFCISVAFMNPHSTHNQKQPKLGLSWGALLLTPPWLYMNGFWVTASLSIIFAYIFWPLSLGISIIFFFKGAKLSWRAGTRWVSANEFEDSEYLWKWLGVAVFLPSLLIVL